MSMKIYVKAGAYLKITETGTRTIIDHCADHVDDIGRGRHCGFCGRAAARRLSALDTYRSDDGFWGHEDWIDELICCQREVDELTQVTIAMSNLTVGGSVCVEAGVTPFPDKDECRRVLG